MSNKDYANYAPNLLKSYDKDIIVEELLEKLKAQGCFDAKRKQFLSEITNKSTYQNLHTKVENLATKFLETVRWPPSVQKHQLREQLRLHIQSTDQFNNCINRLIEQEINCKIQSELKPMIESKACEYLEVNYEKWKQRMLTQIYENFQMEPGSDEKNNHLLNDIKKESLYGDPNCMESDRNVYTDGIQINDNECKTNKLEPESISNQSNIVNSSNLNSNNVKSQPKLQGISLQKSLSQKTNINSNFVLTSRPSMPPPIGLLPPPHRILPNNLFQPLPPPPPPMFLPIERFPPPPPPEDKSLPPPPPPPENGPNTPTDEYIPKFYEVSESVIMDKLKTGSLKNHEKLTDKSMDSKLFSPKKMIWGQVVLSIQDISDESVSDSEKNDHDRRRYSRKSPMQEKTLNNYKESHMMHYEETRQKESWKKNHQDRPIRRHISPRSRQKSNDYTDVSSEGFNEIEFKEVQQSSSSQIGGNKKQMEESGSSDESSSSNDHTLDLIRKINKQKTKLRKRQSNQTLVQSSSSYSSSESSTESSSSGNSQIEKASGKYRNGRRGYCEFGRSQSDEKDMDISADTPSSSIDSKNNSQIREINFDSVESVQMRKNQIKARLEEIDAKRSLLQQQQQQQQMLSTNEVCVVASATFSTSSDSSSDNPTSNRSSNCFEAGRDNKELKSFSDTTLKSFSDGRLNEISENEIVFHHQDSTMLNQPFKSETVLIEEIENKKSIDSEPEEGELSAESRAGSLKRENFTEEMVLNDDKEVSIEEMMQIDSEGFNNVNIVFDQCI